MNIPSGDPGVKMVPFATAFCEWLVRLAGSIATCVEVSEMVSDHVATRGRIPVSAAEDTALAQDLIARGQASPSGATDYQAASQQMTRLGIANTAYGAAWMKANDFVPLAKAAIDRGVAVLFGVYAASNLFDDWTGQPTDKGVQGHGICLVGYDSSGFIVADPNTAQAESGNFVHYSAATLKKAFGQYPSMVIPEASMGTPLDNYFTISGNTYTLKSNPAISFSGGEATLFQEVNGCIGLPTGSMDYSLQGKFYLGFCFRRYERAIVVYDPQHKKDSEPGFGDFYLAHLDDPDFGLAGNPEQLAQLRSQVATEQNTITELQNKLSTVRTSLASAKGSLDSAVQEAAA